MIALAASCRRPAAAYDRVAEDSGIIVMAVAATDTDPWLAKWLDAVRDGRATMSQRARASIERNGGLAAAIVAAEARSVHLVELTDDRGALLVAASRHPFRSLC